MEICSPCRKHAANWDAIVALMLPPKLWNELPLKIMNTTSLASFRVLIRDEGSNKLQWHVLIVDIVYPG